MATTAGPTASAGCTCAELGGNDQVTVETYPVAPSAGGGWRAWEAALARLVGRTVGGPTHCVVITQDPNPRYVQFLGGHGRLHAEVSSNHYLTGDFRLSPNEEQHLRRLGFDLEHDEGFPHNWRRRLDLRDHRDDGLAAALIAHLAEVVALFDPRHTIEVRRFRADHPCASCTWGDEHDRAISGTPGVASP